MGNPELWRHLVLWEVRHALRRPAFRIMLLLALLAPLMTLDTSPGSEYLLSLDPDAARDLFRRELADLFAVALVAQSFLSAAWLVSMVRRAVARSAADDWALVLSWRPWLVACGSAGAVLGLMLAAAAGVGAVIGALALEQVHGLPVPQSVWLLALTAFVAAVLQPVAVTLVVAAVPGFLALDGTAAVTVALLANLAWWLIPGPLTSSAALAQGVEHGSATGGLAMGVALAASLVALALGWWQAEAFRRWNPARLRRRAPDEVAEGLSVGAAREALRTHSGARRRRFLTRAGLRARWQQAGVDSLAAHQLAHFDGLGRGDRVGTLLLALAAIAAVVSVLELVGAGGPFGAHYVLMGLLFAALPLRAVISGAQSVVTEREAQTLESVVLAPRGAARLLDAKLLAVLWQAAPATALLLVAFVLANCDAWRSELGFLMLFAVGYGATLGLAAWVGTLGSALARDRVSAIVGAVVLGIAVQYAAAAAMYGLGWLLTRAVQVPSGPLVGCLLVGHYALCVLALLAARRYAARRMALTA